MTSPTTAVEVDRIHARWPCDRFYCALLDTSVLPKGTRVSEAQLGYLFEAELPEPLEAVHAIYRRLAGGRYLALAVPRERLAHHAPELRDAVSLTPETLPHICMEGTPTLPAASGMNFLVGALESRPVKTLRRRVVVAGVLAAVLAFALLLAGIERRIAAANERGAAAEVAVATRVDHVLPPRSAANPLPPMLRLAAELRTLERTRGVDVSQSGNGGDAVDSLVALLRAWPSDVPVRTETLVVSESSIHAQAQVASNEKADQLSRSLAQLAGWSMDFPRVDAVGGTVRVALGWKRPAAKSGETR
jgi:hypothetical protein